MGGVGIGWKRRLGFFIGEFLVCLSRGTFVFFRDLMLLFVKWGLILRFCLRCLGGLRVRGGSFWLSWFCGCDLVLEIVSFFRGFISYDSFLLMWRLIFIF